MSAFYPYDFGQRLLIGNGENREVGMIDDSLGYAAIKEVPEAFSLACEQNDEVKSVLLSKLYNALVCSGVGDNG